MDDKEKDFWILKIEASWRKNLLFLLVPYLIPFISPYSILYSTVTSYFLYFFIYSIKYGIVYSNGEVFMSMGPIIKK